MEIIYFAVSLATQQRLIGFNLFCSIFALFVLDDLWVSSKFLIDLGSDLQKILKDCLKFVITSGLKMS